jgi:hypothetical protein
MRRVPRNSRLAYGTPGPAERLNLGDSGNRYQDRHGGYHAAPAEGYLGASSVPHQENSIKLGIEIPGTTP